MNTITPDENMQHYLTEARKHAEQDDARPMYHFRPPACWMNDPNGPIYHNGYYHLFYQFHPYGDTWGSMHWGHARSLDLVHWEHLPIALFPAGGDEAHCASGCTILNANHTPMIFYTSFTTHLEDQPYQQRMMYSDQDLLTWQPHPRNPLFGQNAWEQIGVKHTWRDPFIFREAGRTFLILGAKTDHAWQIPLYETEDQECVEWTYRGVLYEVSKQERQSQFLFESPNFTKVGDRWMLLYSPMITAVEYVIGTFDPDSLSFYPETRGVLDKGFQHETGLYATNLFFDPAGHPVLIGWIRGFPPQKGWSGCLSLPRVLSIGPDDHPRQQPVPELHKLRGRHTQIASCELRNASQRLPEVHVTQCEIRAQFELQGARDCGLKIGDQPNPRSGIVIRYDGAMLYIGESHIPLNLAGKTNLLTLHIFIDRSVLEVFVNDGQWCSTQVIAAPETARGMEVFAQNGQVTLKQCDIWDMQAIW